MHSLPEQGLAAISIDDEKRRVVSSLGWRMIERVGDTRLTRSGDLQENTI
jgi:hypothetical protein